MTSTWPYFWLGILCVICIAIGWGARSLTDEVKLSKAMAWGYEENSNLWNRIRVNEKGYVICAKEN
jgi:hypothetical protein